MKPQIIVSTAVPGRNRAGERFTAAHAFELDHFSAEQLKEIAADNVLTLSVGVLLKDAADVDEFVASMKRTDDAGAKGADDAGAKGKK